MSTGKRTCCRGGGGFGGWKIFEFFRNIPNPPRGSFSILKCRISNCMTRQNKLGVSNQCIFLKIFVSGIFFFLPVRSLSRVPQFQFRRKIGGKLQVEDLRVLLFETWLTFLNFLKDWIADWQVCTWLVKWRDDDDEEMFTTKHANWIHLGQVFFGYCRKLCKYSRNIGTDFCTFYLTNDKRSKMSKNSIHSV